MDTGGQRGLNAWEGEDGRHHDRLVRISDELGGGERHAVLQWNANRRIYECPLDRPVAVTTRYGFVAWKVAARWWRVPGSRVSEYDVAYVNIVRPTPVHSGPIAVIAYEYNNAWWDVETRGVAARVTWHPVKANGDNSDITHLEVAITSATGKTIAPVNGDRRHDLVLNLDFAIDEERTVLDPYPR